MPLEPMPEKPEHDAIQNEPGVFHHEELLKEPEFLENNLLEEKEEEPEKSAPKDIERRALKKALGEIKNADDIKMLRKEREGVEAHLDSKKYGYKRIELKKIEKKYIPDLKKEIFSATYQEGLEKKHEISLLQKFLKKMRGE